MQEYYTFLNKNPQRLHQFYNNKSYLIHGHEGETVKLCHGSQVRCRSRSALGRH